MFWALVVKHVTEDYNFSLTEWLRSYLFLSLYDSKNSNDQYRTQMNSVNVGHVFKLETPQTNGVIYSPKNIEMAIMKGFTLVF